MRVLALDTTTREGSVALVEDGLVLVERRGDPSRTHAERLPRELLSLLEDRGLATSDVDLFAVASGPGSFTGLRIGIATVQGLALVHRRRIAAISALDAAAHAAACELTKGASIGVLMDAQRHEVFSALYAIGEGPPFALDRVMEIEGPHVGDAAAVLARWAGVMGERAITVVGDAALACADAIGRRLPGASVHAPSSLAGTIGCLAIAQSRAGTTIEPAAVRPLYVRRPDAEVDRERRNAPPWRTLRTQNP